MTATGLPLGLADAMRAASAGKALPPVEQWHPPLCGDSFMRIARDGTWYHQGEPIRRPALVRLFSTLLRKDEDGFVLVTPAEKLSISVEDAPFMVVLLQAEGVARAQRLTFTTNMGDETVAGADHGLRLGAPDAGGVSVPYLHVRAGLEARLSRSVYHQLADLAVPKMGAANESLGVWSEGVFFALMPCPIGCPIG